jgi:hypothetical protein
LDAIVQLLFAFIKVKVTDDIYVCFSSIKQIYKTLFIVNNGFSGLKFDLTLFLLKPLLSSWNRWAHSELQNESEDEIQKILDMLTEYEIYYPGVEL